MLHKAARFHSGRLLLRRRLGCRDSRRALRRRLNLLLGRDGCILVSSALDWVRAIVAQVDSLLILPLISPLLVRLIELLLSFFIVAAQH